MLREHRRRLGEVAILGLCCYSMVVYSTISLAQERISSPSLTRTPTSLSPAYRKKMAHDRAARQSEIIAVNRNLLKIAVNPETRSTEAIERLYNLSLPWEDLLTVAEDNTLDDGEPSKTQVRVAALKGIAKHGHDAAPAVPRLMELLDSENSVIVHVTVECLEAIGPKASSAVPKLLQLLEEDQVFGSPHAVVANALGAIGPSASPALPMLEEIAFSIEAISFNVSPRDNDIEFHDNSSHFRHRQAAVQACWAAYQAIAKIEPGAALSEKELPRISKESLDGRQSILFFAALDEKVLSPKDSLQLIEDCLASKPPLVVQLRAMQSIAHFEPESPALASILLANIHSFDPLIYKTAETALRNFRPGNEESLKIIASGLEDPMDRVYFAACHALGRYRAEGKALVPSLKIKLEEISDQTKYERIGHLLMLISKIGPDAESLGSTLTEWLPADTLILKGRQQYQAKFLQAYVFYTLGQIGTPPEAAPYVAEKLATAEHPVEFAAAAHAASSLKGDASRLVPLLLQSLEPNFRDHAMSFASFPILGHGAFPDISKNTTAKLEAIRAMEKIGNADAVPSLKSFVERQNLLKQKHQAGLRNSITVLPSYTEAAEHAIVVLSK